MGILGVCQWLEQTSWATAIREGRWLWPTIETLHLFGIVVLVGATSALDLRLLGLVMRQEPVSKLEQRLLPWAWAGFGIQMISGGLMFSSEAVKIYGNGPFRWKMVMLVLVALNFLVFHKGASRGMERWDVHAEAPAAAKVFAALSLLLWLGIVTAGRWIAFVD